VERQTDVVLDKDLSHLEYARLFVDGKLYIGCVALKWDPSSTYNIVTRWTGHVPDVGTLFVVYHGMPTESGTASARTSTAELQLTVTEQPKPSENFPFRSFIVISQAVGFSRSYFQRFGSPRSGTRRLSLILHVRLELMRQRAWNLHAKCFYL
jgi:hypothetical protein